MTGVSFKELSPTTGWTLCNPFSFVLTPNRFIPVASIGDELSVDID